MRNKPRFGGNIFWAIGRIFNRENLRACRLLPKVLSKFDKATLIGLAVAAVIAGFFIWRNYWLNTTVEAAAFGGTYEEGIVGEAKDLDKHLVRLTNAGLTRLVASGEVKGDLAESWEILDEGKTYQFKLRSPYNAQDFAALLASKNLWPNIEVAAPADDLIAFKFKQPFSPFLYISTEPVFPYGPYKIIKEEKNRVILQAQENYWRGKPHIDKIILKLYPTTQALEAAGRQGEVMGYLKKSKDDGQMTHSRQLEMGLPRELLLFFNLAKPDLQSVELRRKLRDGQALDKDYHWTIVTNDKNLAAAENIKARWALLKVDLEIKKYDNIQLQKEIIPQRDYDLLLYSLDYGPDPDPYPLWHSSQNKPEGMNLSNFSNKKADKLLEEARLTFDFAVRDEKYAVFKKILDDEVPFILINKETCYFVLSDKVRGVDKIYGFAEADRFLNVNEWYIKSKRVKK